MKMCITRIAHKLLPAGIVTDSVSLLPVVDYKV